MKKISIGAECFLMSIYLQDAVAQAIEAANSLKTAEALSFMEKSSLLLVHTYQRGGKLLIAGNGGSLCDAMHFAEEMTGQFRKKRRALPAIALSDPGHMSCTANDMGFDQVFVRGVEAFGFTKDLFIALTTSGNSENLYKAILLAKMKGMKTIAFLGKAAVKSKGYVIWNG